jgi:transcriptional regulator with XRE-family HTH domain
METDQEASAALMCGMNARTVSMRGLELKPSRNLTRVLKPTFPSVNSESRRSWAVLNGASVARICSIGEHEIIPNVPAIEQRSQALCSPSEQEARYRARVPKKLKDVLWENIAALLEARQTNARRVAAEAKIGPATMHRLKSEGTSARLDVLERVADALNVEVWQLLKPPSETAYTEEALELAALFDALPNEFERAKANALTRLVLAGQIPPPPVLYAPEPAPAPSRPRFESRAPAPSEPPRRKK